MAPHREVAIRTRCRLSAKLLYKHRRRQRLLLAKSGLKRPVTHPVLALVADSRAPGRASLPCGRAPVYPIRCLGRLID